MIFHLRLPGIGFSRGRRIIARSVLAVAISLTVWALFLLCLPVAAWSADAKDLTTLGLEELMRIEITTSVLKKTEKLSVERSHDAFRDSNAIYLSKALWPGIT